MPVIACPRCQQPLSLDAAVLGQHVQCPACKQVFQTAVAAPVVAKPVVAKPSSPPAQAAARSEPAPDPAVAFAGLGGDPIDGAGASSRKKRSGNRSNLLVVSLVVGGMVLLSCCVGAGFLGSYLINKANPPLVFTPFMARDGSCTVLLPGPPEEGQSGARMAGTTGASYSYSHPVKDVEFMLVYTEYPTDPEQERLLEEFEEYGKQPEIQTRRFPGAILSRKTPVKVGALSGIDHVYEVNGKVVAVIRLLEMKGRKNSCKVLLVARGTDLTEPDRSKFLNSYKQLKPSK